jgi:hypothetical protein
MPVKLTYKDIRHPDFIPAIRKLGSCSDIKNVTLMKNIVKAYRVIVEAEKDCMEVGRKLMDQYGAVQENGQHKILEPVAFEKANNELLATEFHVEVEPFKYNDLVPAKLSAVDVVALGELIIT